MSTAEGLEPSQRLVGAVEAEHQRLRRDLVRVEQRAERASGELHRAVEEREEIRQQLRRLEQLVGAPSRGALKPPALHEPVSLQVEPPNGFLRGNAIRRVAVRLLAGSPERDRAIHYSEWFELLEDAGYGIVAQDPRATFLTQISRSPVVIKGSAPGTYRLDLELVGQLRGRLTQLHDELIGLHHGQQTLEAITSTRARRLELTDEIARVETAVDEANDTVLHN